jgi:hypothetical protein
MAPRSTRIILVTVVLMIAAASYGQTFVNGTFDANLSGWGVDVPDATSVVWYGGEAVFLNPGDFPLDPGFLFQNSFSFLAMYPQPAGQDLDFSRMHQTFTLPANADKISFDVTMEVYNMMAIPETDVFDATIWYGANHSLSKRIYRLSSTDVEYYSLEEEFLLHESDIADDGITWTDHVIYHTPFSYDVTQWAGQNVILTFTLDHDYNDGVRTAVSLDNVAISVKGDVTPPAVTVGEMIQLWPPNHEYRTFHLSDCVTSVTDETSGQIDIDAVGTILSISSDEPEDTIGKGDGNTLDDIVILGNSTFKVRAEREGSGNGRVYTVTFKVADAAGNETVVSFYLGVPHDQSPHTVIVNNGPAAGYTINAF